MMGTCRVLPSVWTIQRAALAAEMADEAVETTLDDFDDATADHLLAVAFAAFDDVAADLVAGDGVEGVFGADVEVAVAGGDVGDDEAEAAGVAAECADDGGGGVRQGDSVVGAEDDAADTAKGVDGVVKVSEFGLGDAHGDGEFAGLHGFVFGLPQEFEYAFGKAFRH